MTNNIFFMSLTVRNQYLRLGAAERSFVQRFHYMQILKLLLMSVAVLMVFVADGGWLYYTVNQDGYKWCYRPYDEDCCFIGAQGGSAGNQVIYPEPTGHLSIPSYLDGRKVLGIVDSARGLRKLTSVTLPSTIKSIGDHAFSGGLIESVTLPGGLESLGGHTFENCTELTDISLPISLVSMGAGVFEGCSNLKSILIPGSLETIPTDAFSECSSLKSVTISDGVKYIKSDAFASCFSIEEIYIPEVISKPLCRHR